MIPPTGQFRRILIGAGCFADARAAFRLAKPLADALALELAGALVEETALSDMATPPRQRVVTASGTLVVAPSGARYRALLESDARAFRDMLHGLTKPGAATFERRQGELIGGMFDLVQAHDLLLLGYRETHRLPGRVVLIAPSPDMPGDAAQLARELARALRTGCTTLSIGPESAGQMPAGWEACQSEDALLARISRIHASAVVLDLSAGPLTSQDQLRHLLSAARCPVVVLGARARDLPAAQAGTPASA